jgi:hypothetical protein
MKHSQKAEAVRQPVPNEREAQRTKCAEHESKKLNGTKPGNRGMCEKQSQSQGSE